MFRLNRLNPEATEIGSGLEPRNINGATPEVEVSERIFRLSPKFDV
jgi:hypothetical protein